MKANLKNVNFKRLAIDHGEKAGMALIALATLYVLWGTTWVPYPEDPASVAQAAQEAQQKIKESAFPEGEKANFTPSVDIRDQTKLVLTPLDASEYAFAGPMYHPLVEVNRAASEPEWLALKAPIADFAKVVIGVKPKEPQAQLAQAEVKKEEKKPAEESEFQARNRGSGSRAVRLRQQLTSIFGRGKGDDDGGGAAPAPRVRRGNRSKRGEDDQEQQLAAGALANEGGGLNAQDGSIEFVDMEARGQRFIAVRGVFPLREQRQEIKKALNLRSEEDAEQYLTFLDFELERKEAIKGPDPWAGPWTKVDVQVARETLAQAVEFDTDPVDPGVLDDVFTMPLPFRADGIWTDIVSHDLVKNYKLSETEMEQQVEINRRIIEAERKRQRESQPKDQPLQKGGFAEQQYDMRGLRDRYAEEEFGEIEKGLKEDAAREGETDPDKLAQAIRAKLKKDVTAAGQVLLFRYLDFAVKPYNAYKYRVRFVVANPNYGRNLAEVVTPEVAAGRTRLTPWSEETEPVYIPGDARYFLVNSTPGDAGGIGGKAQVDFYRWLPDLGTSINERLTLAIGDFVGLGKLKTHVLDVARDIYEEREVNALTDDILIDVDRTPTLPRDAELHADLALAANMRSLPIPDRAIVIDAAGELRQFDSVSSKEDHERASRRFQAERKPWEKLITESLEEKKAGNSLAGEEERGLNGRIRGGRNPNRR